MRVASRVNVGSREVALQYVKVTQTVKLYSVTLQESSIYHEKLSPNGLLHLPAQADKMAELTIPMRSLSSMTHTYPSTGVAGLPAINKRGEEIESVERQAHDHNVIRGLRAAYLPDNSTLANSIQYNSEVTHMDIEEQQAMR
jgi:hypothetical protein